MTEDEKIIELFFRRSEQAIEELDSKYGRVFYKLSYNIVNNGQDAEECVNDAYLGAWNAIPPARPDPLLTEMEPPSEAAAIQPPWRKSKAVSRTPAPWKTKSGPGSWRVSLKTFWTR